LGWVRLGYVGLRYITRINILLGQVQGVEAWVIGFAMLIEVSLENGRNV